MALACISVGMSGPAKGSYSAECDDPRRGITLREFFMAYRGHRRLPAGYRCVRRVVEEYQERCTEQQGAVFVVCPSGGRSPSVRWESIAAAGWIWVRRSAGWCRSDCSDWWRREDRNRASQELSSTGGGRTEAFLFRLSPLNKNGQYERRGKERSDEAGE